MCFAPQRLCTFSTSNGHRIVKSGSEPWCVLYTFDFQMCFAPQRRALFRHRMAIGSSKSGPNVVCFVHFYFQMCFAPQRRALFRHRNVQKSVRTTTSKCASRHNGVHFFDIATSKSGPNADVFCTFLLPNVLRATTACTFSTSQLPKVVRTWCALPLLTSKCASRHNGVHFFHISTSKSAPTLTCFATFYFQMCFAPQRRALFPHLNFQKWSENGVFCHF